MKLLLPLILAIAALPIAAGEISTAAVNGEAVVTWNGAEVWRGRTTAPLRAAKAADGAKEVAAAFDGDKTVWESEPGAGAKVRALAPELRATPKPPRGPVVGKGINTRIAEGATVVMWQGREVWRGTTRGLVTSRSRSLDGVEVAAAFDGAKVVWESEPGAGERLRAKE